MSVTHLVDRSTIAISFVVGSQFEYSEGGFDLDLEQGREKRKSLLTHLVSE